MAGINHNSNVFSIETSLNTYELLILNKSVFAVSTIYNKLCLDNIKLLNEIERVRFELAEVLEGATGWTYAHYVDSSQILSKIIGHCLKCHKQFCNTVDNNNSGELEVFECDNKSCFVKPRLYIHIFDAETLDFNPKLSKYIKFRLCLKCGKDCKDLYNSMVTGYFVNNGKINDKDKDKDKDKEKDKNKSIRIQESETDYEKYKQQTFDHSTIQNEFFASFSFESEQNTRSQKARYPSDNINDWSSGSESSSESRDESSGDSSSGSSSNSQSTKKIKAIRS